MKIRNLKVHGAVYTLHFEQILESMRHMQLIPYTNVYVVWKSLCWGETNFVTLVFIIDLNFKILIIILGVANSRKSFRYVGFGKCSRWKWSPTRRKIVNFTIRLLFECFFNCHNVCVNISPLVLNVIDLSLLLQPLNHILLHGNISLRSTYAKTFFFLFS